MKAALRLGSWRGIDIRAHWSLLVIGGILAWSLADSALPANAGGYSTGAYWVAGVLTAVVFLASITAHEMGHSFVAQHRGIHVHQITLWLFGGIAEFDNRPTTWQNELSVAIAGPAVSATVGIGAIAAALVVWGTTGSGLITAALAWLGSTNVLLAAFNLLPGAPLDGGRVFTALRWRRHGSAGRARQEAARAGVIVASGLIALGVFVVFLGAAASGLWLAFLGWFLSSAARAEQGDIETRHVLDRLTVDEVMTPNPAMVPDMMTLDTLVGTVLPKIHGSTVPVVHAGHLTGLITPDRLRRVAPGEWRMRTTADIATPVDELVTAHPDEMLLDVLDRMGTSERRIVVLDARDNVIGLVTPTDLVRTIRVARLRDALPV